MTVIELEGVEKSYGDLKVLKGIDLEVERERRNIRYTWT